jgi:hypothetical protein
MESKYKYKEHTFCLNCLNIRYEIDEEYDDFINEVSKYNC